MKVRIDEDGQQFPPLLRDAPSVHMIYPPHTAEEEQVALGHALFSMQPGLFVMSTVWLREHNRICDVLSLEHPDWNDERLYQTSKLIVLAQNLKITIEEYVQHLSQYKVKLSYDPELLRDEPQFQFSFILVLVLIHVSALLAAVVGISSASWIAAVSTAAGLFFLLLTFLYVVYWGSTR